MQNSKGFSLIELLVVVSIISIIAGTGLVGYQQYVEAAKRRIADTNWRNVIEYLKLETSVINNGILKESPTAKVGSNDWVAGTNSLNEYLNGAASYHDLGTGLANFKNPYANSNYRQVYSAANASDVADSEFQSKGSIVLRVHLNFPNDGPKTTGLRNFQAVYYKADGVEDSTRIVDLKFE